MEYSVLSNGVLLPKIGFGTFQITDAAQCEECAGYALETGYRLYDAALKAFDASLWLFRRGGPFRKPSGIFSAIKPL